jgi:hypothetical protein
MVAEVLEWWSVGVGQVTDLTPPLVVGSDPHRLAVVVHPPDEVRSVRVGPRRGRDDQPTGTAVPALDLREALPYPTARSIALAGYLAAAPQGSLSEESCDEATPRVTGQR